MISWVGHKQELRRVSFSDEALNQLKQLENHFKFYKNAEEMEVVLREVLAADVSKRSDRRLSEFEFDCLSILFSAKDEEIHVEQVLMTIEFENLKQEGVNLLSCIVEIQTSESDLIITGFAHSRQFSSQRNR